MELVFVPRGEVAWNLNSPVPPYLFGEMVKIVIDGKLIDVQTAKFFSKPFLLSRGNSEPCKSWISFGSDLVNVECEK